MSEFRSPRFLANVVVVLLAVCCVIDLASIVSGLMQSELIDRMPTGDYTEAELAWNDARAQGLGILELIALVATAIAFIVWFRRAYLNLDSFGHTRSLQPGWTIFAWFVPVVSLYRPFQMMREIWLAPRSAAVRGRGGHSRTRPATRALLH